MHVNARELFPAELTKEITVSIRIKRKQVGIFMQIWSFGDRYRPSETSSFKNSSIDSGSVLKHNIMKGRENPTKDFISQWHDSVMANIGDKIHLRAWSYLMSLGLIIRSDHTHYTQLETKIKEMSKSDPIALFLYIG